MDQDTSKGQDKRNWRERLGIGAQGAKDLPKISDDFRQEPSVNAPRPVASARPAPRATPQVKPAPMAPRANPKPIQPAPPAAASDKLAERLRSQREASTKLAEQRVQVAKQRAETPPPPQPVARPAAAYAPKPKFTFAEDASAAPPVAAAPSRPLPPPVQHSAPPAQMAPARPPLGGGSPPVFQPRPQAQPPAYVPQPQYQPQPPQQQAPGGYQPQYNPQPVPPYRPIDPQSGFVQPPVYQPQQRGFAPQPGQFAPPQNQPRLNVPQRGGPALNPNFAPPQDFGGAGQPGFGAPAQQGFGAPPPRMARPQMRSPAPLPELPEDDGYQQDFDDQANELNARRPSTNDYQQAYREAEFGFEEEAPASRAPWILAGLLLLALAVAGLGVWLYLSSVKPLMNSQSTTEDVPAVAAPDAPAKVQAEPTIEQPSAGAGEVPTKKKIYDRIVGDQEVLGGDLAPAVETPAAVPEPTNNAVPAGNAGEEAAPLPIPPPPGDQQGALPPADGQTDSAKQSAENITPAAGESLAAVAASGADDSGELRPGSSPIDTAPVPGELNQEASQPKVSEAINDPVPSAVVKKKVVVNKPKVAAEKKLATRSLGSKPVVLVPPAKQAAMPRKPRPQVFAAKETPSGDDNGGLYGSSSLNTSNTDVAPVVAATPAKRKTLSDLFKGEDAATSAPSFGAADAPVQPVAPLKPQARNPAPQQQASLGGFSSQLASFRTREEASTEFRRLNAKYPSVLGRFSPIISEALVGGSTRYRLNVGGMSSKAQASAVCSSLFAGGERDCLVKSQ